MVLLLTCVQFQLRLKGSVGCSEYQREGRAYLLFLNRQSLSVVGVKVLTSRSRCLVFFLVPLPLKNCYSFLSFFENAKPGAQPPCAGLNAATLPSAVRLPDGPGSYIFVSIKKY